MMREINAADSLLCHRKFDFCVGEKCTLWNKVETKYDIELVDCDICPGPYVDKVKNLQKGELVMCLLSEKWSWLKLGIITEVSYIVEKCPNCNSTGKIENVIREYDLYDCKDNM